MVSELHEDAPVMMTGAPETGLKNGSIVQEASAREALESANWSEVVAPNMDKPPSVESNSRTLAST